MNQKTCKKLRRMAKEVAKKFDLPKVRYSLSKRKDCIVLDACERKVYKDLKNVK